MWLVQGYEDWIHVCMCVCVSWTCIFVRSGTAGFLLKACCNDALRPGCVCQQLETYAVWPPVISFAYIGMRNAPWSIRMQQSICSSIMVARQYLSQYFHDANDNDIIRSFAKGMSGRRRCRPSTVGMLRESQWWQPRAMREGALRPVVASDPSLRLKCGA